MSMREAVLKTFTEYGLSSGVDPHNWRCYHPDRYGPCECAEDIADAVLVAVRGEILDAIRLCAPYNMELNTDPDRIGTEDPQAAAYVEGVHAAHDAVQALT